MKAGIERGRTRTSCQKSTQRDRNEAPSRKDRCSRLRKQKKSVTCVKTSVKTTELKLANERFDLYTNTAV